MLNYPLGSTKPLVDLIQSKYSCCGVEKAAEWFALDWHSRRGNWSSDDIPYSCCSNALLIPCIHLNLKKHTYYVKYNSSSPTIWTSGCVIKSTMDEADFKVEATRRACSSPKLYGIQASGSEKQLQHPEHCQQVSQKKEMLQKMQTNSALECRSLVHQAAFTGPFVSPLMSKMDDSNADYLTKYREFIESLLKTTDLDYPLPVNVAKYNIAEFEITGEILNWCLTYLNERNCPNSLAAPLCCKVLEEIHQVAKEDPESCGYRTREDDFQPLKLMQRTIKKLVDVCIYYSDNAKLSTLLPPPSSTLLDPPVSLCGVKNSRRKMEDRHVAIQDLHALFNIKDCGSASYYAIFDGHNGVDAAAYSSCHVHQYLVESPHYPHNPELALKEAFQKTDDRFVDKSNKENLDSGTTALAALIRPNESMLYVAWLGDSQAVLVSQGKAYQLVKPHRPDQPDERTENYEFGRNCIIPGNVEGQWSPCSLESDR
ncbi:hypothetical protein GE061_002101 [Apolygus lucorum]|uniref:PPM-type phosphatase domain-containing protein n=1 Tax=Apolygus lucorum TaxID=248454 RepID=A0A8S9X6S1_APOLU|nr:hypothetical protein GE061_002101 [Apolygus lucorum]